LTARIGGPCDRFALEADRRRARCWPVDQRLVGWANQVISQPDLVPLCGPAFGIGEVGRLGVQCNQHSLHVSVAAQLSEATLGC
jgi:hypothetical protein